MQNQLSSSKNIFRAFKTELDLNNQQRTACLRHAGAARFAYNWGLERKCTERGKLSAGMSNLSMERHKLPCLSMDFENAIMSNLT